MPHTLLLADDSVTIQRVIELTFADEDISVVAFSDGERALAALNHTPPDIVLADVGMPGRSGYDVARYVKQTPALSHIPVLLLTGAFEPVDQTKAREVGCDGILTKPFDPQLVISRVKELLQKTARPDGSTSTAGILLDRAADVENYFEQLDQAFATLASAPAVVPGPALPARSEPVARHEPVEVLAFRPSGEFVRTVDRLEPREVIEDSQAVAPVLSAFSALLTAERDGESPEAALATLAPPPVGPPVSFDEIVDQVTARVLAKLSGGMVREAVADVLTPAAERMVHGAITDIVTPVAERVVRSTIVDIVSTTAERLIREEIARIKSNIK